MPSICLVYGFVVAWGGFVRPLDVRGRKFLVLGPLVKQVNQADHGGEGKASHQRAANNQASPRSPHLPQLTLRKLPTVSRHAPIVRSRRRRATKNSARMLHGHRDQQAGHGGDEQHRPDDPIKRRAPFLPLHSACGAWRRFFLIARHTPIVPRFRSESRTFAPSRWRPPARPRKRVADAPGFF
jgi:hypothetical protein